VNKFLAKIRRLFEWSEYLADAFFIQKEFLSTSIILYGAGESSHWFVEVVMKMHDFIPIAVLDRRFKEGDQYEGVPAFSPLDYRPTDDEKEKATVVICSGKPEHNDEIYNCLRELGFVKIIFLKDIYEVHNPFSEPKLLQQQGFGFYLNQKKSILSAFEFFDDEESKEVFQCFLQTHMQRKPVSIPARPREEQYFPKDIKLAKGYSHFVSCGAYDGDTIRLLNQEHGMVDSIVCFEAEPAIFTRLSSYLQANKSLLAENVVALPCAVYSHEVMMPFTSATGLGSRISLEGDSFVQCVALDHILPDFTPSFISMDIEGAEPEALIGAEKMIRKYQPDLAICVYHAPNHLWDIPIYLHSLGLGYTFYLRNYTSFTIETVLYATVEQSV